MANYEPTRFSAELIARLRGQIARFDINQAQLALLCDVSQSQFSKIIRGVRPATIDQVAVICEVLELDMGKLFAEVEEFVSSEDSYSSPVIFVSAERKLSEPRRIDHRRLDDWGKNVAFEWDTTPSVSSPIDDVESETPAEYGKYGLAAHPETDETGEEIFD